jgi:Mg2+ and Co2+ transporter CorA
MMKETAFELTESSRLTEVDTADARRRWRAGDGAFWIDLTECSPGDLETILDELNVGGFLKRRVLRAGKETSVIALRDAAFFEWAVFADVACSRRAHVAALCLKNLLVTVQSDPIENPVESQQPVDLSELGPLSTASVLCSILLWQGARTARAARVLREQLLQMDQRMDEDPGSVEESELAQLKTDLLRADAISEEQDEAFRVLSEVQTDALSFSSVKGSMSLLTSSANATRRLDDRLQDRFQELRHRASEYRQDALNRRLGFLTVISTVFLPLTLLAGIWGMNFDTMPELKHPYGYPLALGVMVLIAGVVAWSLRKRGWFD